MSKALVMVFPHKICARKEDDLRKLAGHIHFGMEIYGKLIQELDEAAKRISQRADRIYSILWQDQYRKTPEILKRFDFPGAIKFECSAIVDTQKQRWIKAPDFPSIVARIPEDRIIVAGFHYDDCVSKFAAAASEAGKEVFLSPMLTDVFYNDRCKSKLAGVSQLIPLPDEIPPRVFASWYKKAAEASLEFLPNLGDLLNVKS